MGKGVEYAYQVRYWKKLPKPKKKETPPPELPVNPDEVFILVLYYCMFPKDYLYSPYISWFNSTSVLSTGCPVLYILHTLYMIIVIMCNVCNI